MNKKLTTACVALNASSYISPVAKITEIHSEGVLCISMNMLLQQDMGHEEWLEQTLSW